MIPPIPWLGRLTAMLFSTASMEEARGGAQEENGQMEEDQSADDWSMGMEKNKLYKEGREASTLQTNMNTATVLLQVKSKEGSEFLESGMSVRSHDLDLSLDEY